MKLAPPDRLSYRLTLRGMVQGQGIRPTIAQLAERMQVAGSVRNTTVGVEVRAIGSAEQLQAFVDQLRRTLRAEVTSQPDTEPMLGPDAQFRILASDTAGNLQTVVPLDLATCADCQEDFDNHQDRRADYLFLSCPKCGPRYSVLTAMPFDRSRTSLARFSLCDECQAEYSSPSDRRFHAQTVACPKCGPAGWISCGKGMPLSLDSDTMDSEKLQQIVATLRSGKIAAVLGMGGYQLLVDATNATAIAELRHRKRRPTKPLPMMVSDLEAARRIGIVSNAEVAALTDAANPIVLLRAGSDLSLPPQLAPGLDSVGVMLPTTPLHRQLLQQLGRPLVVTSGNLHGQPIAYRPDDALKALGHVADLFFHHHREVLRPVDDSLVQCVGGHRMTLRSARGLAPQTFPFAGAGSVLAVGGHQKVSIAFSTGNQLVLSPYIGDMDSEASRIRFEQTAVSLQQLIGVQPKMIVHDQHPDYFTTRWAQSQTLPTIAVQHHHAHVAAAMLEHGLTNDSVLGMALDGSGYGDDETVWGGEFLIANCQSYQRVGHLRCFALPGGERAIKQPQRIAGALLAQLCDRSLLDRYWQTLSSDLPLTGMLRALDHGVRTSSMGRLFDGVAALVLGIAQVDFEGEAAMRLEAACDWSEQDRYHFAIQPGDPWELDWRPVVQQIQQDLATTNPRRIAMRFHRAVAMALLEIAQQHPQLPCLLTGGVFQNRTLLELIEEASRGPAVDVRLPGVIPINDGGLAMGQLVVACSQPMRGEPCA